MGVVIIYYLLVKHQTFKRVTLMRISPFFIHEFLDCPDMVVDIPSDTPYYTSESNNPKFSQSLFGCRSGDILGYYAF